MVTQRHGNYMKFSLGVLANYSFVIRATNETGESTNFVIKDIEVVMSRIIQEDANVANIPKDLFKALIANNMLEYSAEDVAFLVC